LETLPLLLFSLELYLSHIRQSSIFLTFLSHPPWIFFSVSFFYSPSCLYF
jgi:hypothetical protein